MAKSLQSLHRHKTEQSFKAYVDTDLEDHRHTSTLLSNQRPLVENPYWLSRTLAHATFPCSTVRVLQL